jgi:hypothetical protein
MESDATVVCAFVESQVAAKQEGWVALDSVYPYTGLSKGVCHFNRSSAGVNTACAAQETQATQRAIAWLRCGDEAAVRAAVKTNVTGYANVTAADETALQAAVWSSGVISAAINSDADAFMFYSGGPLGRIPACTLNCRCTCGCITFITFEPLLLCFHYALSLAGILDIPASKCSTAPADLDHGVAIVGYGTAGTTDY